jgi:hypothetical protein
LIELHAKQTEAFELAVDPEKGKRVVIYGGAIRGGKSWWLFVVFVYLALAYKNSRWAIIRNSVPNLDRNTIPSFKMLMSHCEKSHLLDNWKKSNGVNIITFPNGSTIQFMPESFHDDPELNRFRGLEINGLGFDEINECQKDTYIKALERVGSWGHAKGNPPMVIAGTVNPTKNWVKKEFYEKYLNGELEDWMHFIPALITDNPYLDPDYVASLKSTMPPHQYKRFVEGDWDIPDAAQNPWAWGFEVEKHVKPCKINPHLPLIVSVDFNLKPMCITFAHVESNVLKIVSEVAIDSAQIFKACDAIITVAPVKGLIRLTGDAMGQRRSLEQRSNLTVYQQMLDYMKISERQLFVKNNPTHENSRMKVNSILYEGRFMIDPSCKGSIYDLMSVECDAEGSIIKSNRKIQAQQADFLDTIRYIAHNFMS